MSTRAVAPTRPALGVRRTRGVPVGHVLRLAQADAGLLAVTTAVVALVALLACAVPRLLERAGTDEVRAAVGDAPSLVVATRPDAQAPGTVQEGTADELAATAQLLRSRLPRELATVVTGPTAALVGPALRAGSVDDAPLQVRFVFLAASSAPDDAPLDLTSPEAGALTWVEGGPPAGPSEAEREQEGLLPVQVALSAEAARLLGVGVGGELPVKDLGGETLAVRVSGVYDVTTPDEPAWGTAPTAVHPRVVGGAEPRVEVAALTSAASVPAARYDLPEDRVAVTYTFGAVPGRVDLASAAHLAEVTAALASAPSSLELPGRPPFVTTRLDTSLGEALGRVAAVRAQAGVVLSGVVAAALLALVLAASLLVRRRAATVEHQRTLGATVPQVASAAVLESAGVVAVGAVVGVVGGQALVPGPVPWPWLLPPLVLALVAGPVLVVRAAARPTAPPPARRSVRAPRGAALRRPLAEAAVVLLAVASTAVLRARGVASTASTPAADLVVSAAPALVAAAVALVLLRLLPPAARLWRRAAARRPGLVPFVAAARVRVHLAPVLSLVLVATLLALSACVLATVRAGREVASWQAVGGDVVATAAADDVLELPAPRPGLLVAGARVVDGTQLLGDGVDATARLVALDAAAERELLARTPTPDAPELARLGGAPAGAPVPALVSGVPASRTDLRLVWEGISVPLAVVGTAPALPAGAGPEATVVVDRAALADAIGAPVDATTVWLVGPAAREAAATAGGATTVSRPEWLDGARRAPTSAALGTLLSAGAALLVLLGAVTVVLTAAQGRPARRRASTQLRVLGMRRGGSTRLAFGELAPPVLAASVAGVLTGVALGALLTSSLGLGTVTRQLDDPSLVVPPVVLLGVVVPALALLAAVVAERPRRAREDLARVMRAG